MPDLIITPGSGLIEFIKEGAQSPTVYRLEMAEGAGLILNAPLTSSVGMKAPNMMDSFGNNTFAGTSTFNGPTVINGNLSVFGTTNLFSASNVYISSSQLTIEDNILTLNAFSPFLRYAGIEMIDSGSGTLSSMLWDGQGDYFFLSGSSVNGKILTGPDGQSDLTSGYVPKATAGYKLGNSLIYDDGSRVGINTTAPSSSLTIQSNGTQLRLQTQSAPGSFFANIGSRYDSTRPFTIEVANNSSTPAEFMGIYADSGGANNRVVFPTGNIGIGTTNPTQKLEVAGYVMAGEGLYRTNIYGSNGGAWIGFGDTGSLNSLGRIGAYGALFNINSLNGDTSFQYNSAEKMRITTGGNLGLGITNPAAYVNANATYFRPSLDGLYSSIYATTEAVVNLISSGSADGAAVGGVYFTRARAQGDAHFQIAAIKAFQAGTSNTIAGGTLYFYTKNNNGGTAATDPAMVIGPGGNVGIGTTGPNTKLHIYGTGGGFEFGVGSSNCYIETIDRASVGKDLNTAFYTRGTGSFTWHNGSYTERMRIDGTGNVGINISTPAYKTEIYSGAKTSAFTGLAISNFNNYDGTAASLVTSQLRFAILESPITTYDASQRTFAILESGNEVNNSSSDGFFAISTRSGGAVAQKFRITSTGNVGIGTTDPATRLDVVGLNGSFPTSSGATQATGSILRLRNGNSNLVLDIGGHGGNGNWIQSTNRSDLSVNYPLLLNPNGGNVGIGSTSPGTKLDVAGEIRMPVIKQSTTLYAGTDITDDDSTRTVYFNIPAGGYSPTRYFKVARIKITGNYQNVSLNGYFTAPNSSLHVGFERKVEFDFIAYAATNPGAPQVTYLKRGSDTTTVSVYAVPSGSGAGTTHYDVYIRSGWYNDTNGELAIRVGYGSAVTVWQSGLDSGTSAPADTLVNPNSNYSFDTTGNIGIGSTSPAYKLDIGAAGNNNVSVRLTPGYERVRYYGFDLLGYNDGNLWMMGNNPTNTLLLSNNWDWDYQVGFAYTPGTVGNAAGVLQIGQISKNNANYTHGITRLYTNGLERLTIIANGNIGIGTSSPNSKLNVIAGNTPGVSIQSNNSGQYAYLYVGRTANDLSVGVSGGTDQFFVGTVAGDAIIKKENGNKLMLGVGSGAPTITINSSNFVGIGTTSPTASLHVNSTTAGATLIRADGTNGTLFSVVDDLSDSLMSANNSAGLPVFEVFADDRIVAGQYGQNDFVIVNNKVGIGTNNPIAELHVTSSTSTPSAVFLGGSVGIGTSSPGYKLDVAGSLGINASASDTNWPFVVSDNSSAGSRYSLNKMGSMGFNYADTYAQLQLLGSAGAYLDFSSVVGGDSNARLIYYANDRIDLTYGFTTTLTLRSSNAGIGTTAPRSGFQINTINGSSGNEYAGLTVSATVSASRGVNIAYDATNDIGVIQSVYNGVTWKGLSLSPQGGGVGIGTIAPASTLHVVGVISGSSFTGAGTGLTGTAASLTAGTANALNASNNYQVNSIGVNIAGSGTAGRIGTNENGVRSWTITPTGGKLVFDSGDGLGSANFTYPVSASVFSGAGTGLTGTAANLTVGTALNVGNGTLTISTGTGIGIGATTTFTANQSGNSTITLSNTGVTAITTNTGLSTNASATGAVTITNTGVTSNVAGTGISVSGATGAVTITNSGVTSAVAGTGVGVSAATGSVTFSIGQAVGTGNTPTFAGATLNGQLNVNHSVSTAIVRLWNAGSTVWSLGVNDTSGNYFNISADFGSLLINKTNGSIWISGSGINNTVLHNNSTLPAGNLSGTIPAGVLSNSSLFVGTSQIALNRASGAQTLNGVSIDGNAATSTIVNGTNGQLLFKDIRAIAPNNIAAGYLQFGFTTWANTLSTTPYADYLHLRSYTDSSGGNDNLVMFRKDVIGMRIWQQSFGSATNYSTYKDVAFTDQIGNGTITIAAGTGVGVGTTNTFTTNQSGATTVTISNTGVTSVAGTTNQVSVSAGTGAVTFSLPQNIHTAATPTFASVTTSADGANITMAGTTNAEGIRMTAASSATYPVFLRSLNPGSGGESSPWIYKEAAADWGIWHNNPVNSIDFTKQGSGGIASNVGGSSTNTVTVRVEMATGYVQTIAGYRNSAGTTILSDTGNITGNAATVTTNANLTGDVTSVGNATTIASNAVTSVKIADSNVTLAKIVNISTGTILGNNGAGAAAPLALTSAQVASMLSGQTMNIAGSSTSCTGNAATATTATTANALNTGNSYTGVNFTATGYFQTNLGQIKSDTLFALLTTSNGAQGVSARGLLLGTSYDTTPNANEIRTTANQSLVLNARGTGQVDIYTNDSTKVTVLNGGNVGIGTSNPSRKLDVEGIVRTRGASGTGGFEIGAATTGAARWRIEWDSASDSLDFNWVA